jgi:hypothetical protein
VERLETEPLRNYKMNNDAVDSGMMIEFENPRTGDSALLPSFRALMLSGYSRSEAAERIRVQMRLLGHGGFRHITVSRQGVYRGR